MAISNKISNFLRKHKEVPAYLISDDINRFYFTGFKSTYGHLLITPFVSKLFIDERYSLDAVKELPLNVELVVVKPYEALSVIKKFLKDSNISNIGIDFTSYTLSESAKLREELSGIEISDASNAIIGTRNIKTEEEIAGITAAIAITEKVLLNIIRKIKANVTELDLSIEIEHQLRLNGADSVAFPVQVSFGENTAKPHSRPTGKKLMRGDNIMFDFGCILNGYCSDITRTYAFGGIKPELKTIYNIVLGAQKHAINAISAGLTCREADAFARQFIKANAYADEFVHALGHGVGLQVHESPSLSVNSDTVLQKNMVVTIEPGIYIKGLGGVRIEDMIVIGDSKNTVFTTVDKELTTI